MSYEDAIQTRLLATHCCCCGRPLCDAVSVELGMGPICRAEHGVPNGTSDEVRELCNKLTYAAAVYAQRGQVVEVRKCAAAIRATGLEVLATRIEERFVYVERRARIRIEVIDDGKRLAVTTPYKRKPEFIAAWRAIPGRRWDGARQLNTLPIESRPQLWSLLKTFFLGEPGIGCKGPFIVA